jgi:hypothetical protein
LNENSRISLRAAFTWNALTQLSYLNNDMLQQLVDVKREESHQLLTEEACLDLIAKEQGVRVVSTDSYGDGYVMITYLATKKETTQ